MKKIVALALTVVMVLGLLTGCQKPMDAKTLTQKMDEAMKTVTAVGGKMDMDMDMTMSMTGMTMDLGMDMEADVKYKMDMSAGYIGIKFGFEAMGQSEQMEMENYIVSEGDQIVSYVHESATDSWVKTTQDTAELKTMQEELMGTALKFNEIPVENMTLAEEKETLNGKSCYVLNVNMDGAYFQEAMNTMMDTMTEELEEMEAELFDGIDWSALNVKLVYHVDAETFRTVQMTGEIQGMGDVMNSLFGTLMGAFMMGEDAAAMEFSIDVPVCTFSMTGMTYDDTEIPTVPQEAIDNAVDADSMVIVPGGDITGEEDYMEELGNPAQADGSYLLSYEGCSASLRVPEGFVVYLSEADMLVAMTEDMMESISYVLVCDLTSEDMNIEFDSTVQMYQEEEYYYSHGDLESVNGFTLKSLVSTDGTYEVYAWKDIPGGVLLITGSSFEGEPNLTDALNAIVTE